MRTGFPAKRGCCRPLVVWSQVPHQYLVLCKEAYAIHADQKTESADRAVRTSSPAIGWCCGLCGEKANFHAQREREREREAVQPASILRAKTERIRDQQGLMVCTKQTPFGMSTIATGVCMIRETQRWRHDLSKHKPNMSMIETWSLETATETKQTSLLKIVV